MVAMNLFAYLPYHSLLKALGQRGFIKANDRPTIRKAIKELAVDPARSLSRKSSRWLSCKTHPTARAAPLLPRHFCSRSLTRVVVVLSAGSKKRSSRTVAPAVSPALSPAVSPANERDRSRSGVDPCAPGGNPNGGLDMA